MEIKCGPRLSPGKVLFAVCSLGVFSCKNRNFNHLKSAPESGKPSQSELFTLQKLAEQYAVDLRKYNISDYDPISDEPLEKFPEGRVSYWDIPEDFKDYKILGLKENLRSATDPTKFRIYNHYLDAEMEKSLTSLFGRKPDGNIRALMTSSPRTLLLVPEKSDPFFMKLSHWAPHETDSRKLIKHNQVERSVYFSQLFSNDRKIVREPSGSVLGLTVPVNNLNTHAQIFRPFPVNVGEANSADRLVPLHVALSKDFVKKFPQYYPLGFRSWVKNEFSDQYTQFILDCFLKYFAAFDLHSQNIDLLLSAKRQVSKEKTIKKFFVKDLNDLAEDGVMAAVYMDRHPELPARTRALGGASSSFWFQLDKLDSYGGKSGPRWDQIVVQYVDNNLAKGIQRFSDLESNSPDRITVPEFHQSLCSALRRHLVEMSDGQNSSSSFYDFTRPEMDAIKNHELIKNPDFFQNGDQTFPSCIAFARMILATVPFLSAQSNEEGKIIEGEAEFGGQGLVGKFYTFKHKFSFPSYEGFGLSINYAIDPEEKEYYYRYYKKLDTEYVMKSLGRSGLLLSFSVLKKK